MNYLTKKEAELNINYNFKRSVLSVSTGVDRSITKMNQDKPVGIVGKYGVFYFTYEDASYKILIEDALGDLYLTKASLTFDEAKAFTIALDWVVGNDFELLSTLLSTPSSKFTSLLKQLRKETKRIDKLPAYYGNKENDLHFFLVKQIRNLIKA